MTAAPSMVCSRCNRLSAEAGTCSKCGTRLATRLSQERRGWVSFGASVFLIVFMSAVWVWVDGLLGANVRTDAALAQFEGRLNVAFALVVIAGVFGVANGWLMARSGIRNRILIFGLVIVFASALFVACSATGVYHPS
jgi:hypothetical protein